MSQKERDRMKRRRRESLPDIINYGKEMGFLKQKFPQKTHRELDKLLISFLEQKYHLGPGELDWSAIALQKPPTDTPS